MICKTYLDLSPIEKVMFIGELTHSYMSDEELYKIGVKLIDVAKAKGIFDNVVIMPNNQNDINNDTENKNG